MNEDMQDLLTRTCEKYAAAHAKAVNELDERQFAAVLEQMIKAGDFVKFVQGRGQKIVYLPWLEGQGLEAENQRLKAWKLNSMKIIDSLWDDRICEFGTCGFCYAEKTFRGENDTIDLFEFKHEDDCELKKLLAAAAGFH